MGAGIAFMAYLIKEGEEETRRESSGTLHWQTRTQKSTFHVNVRLFDILMVRPDFTKQMMHDHCK